MKDSNVCAEYSTKVTCYLHFSDMGQLRKNSDHLQAAICQLPEGFRGLLAEQLICYHLH